MRNSLIILLMVLPSLLLAQDKVSNYIDTYKAIAVSEMHRSGIPASITLAQGMFESGYGLSESAQHFNNHFGIKCKKEWDGAFYFKKDDDRDAQGNLIESCFRAYGSVEASYEDHTNFLLERPRYAELFTFYHTDYQNWAMGLERCGYATNPMYAERLIEIIERYNLWEIDQQGMVIADATATPNIEDQDDIVVAQIASEGFSINEKTADVPAIDTIALLKIRPTVVQVKATKNRINQAILLPSNYQRRVQQSQETTDFK